MLNRAFIETLLSGGIKRTNKNNLNIIITWPAYWGKEKTPTIIAASSSCDKYAKAWRV
ncbi:hypothetical protein SAMN05421737_104213 [Shouchella lonarensis]|uniref:Uncharacterized protein n=1 Tax=Shouchella lonarensis TaxID=1464122 RepID=A0A1G6HWD4_9BACI|nr:hypothetical protein SAMN05421737_104213 [Shouchella lonarensis]